MGPVAFLQALPALAVLSELNAHHRNPSPSGSLPASRRSALQGSPRVVKQAGVPGPGCLSPGPKLTMVTAFLSHLSAPTTMPHAVSLWKWAPPLV